MRTKLTLLPTAVKETLRHLKTSPTTWEFIKGQTAIVWKRLICFPKNEKLHKHPIIFTLGLHNAAPLICLKHMYKGTSHTCTSTHAHTHTIFKLFVLLFPFISRQEESTDSLMKLARNLSFLHFGKSNDSCDKLQIKLIWPF